MANLLYVEDHPPAQILMQAIVAEMTGHQLTIAGSGDEARATAKRLAPDLYIVDLDLPDTDGVALARDLKAIHAAPVVLVSAYAEAVKESNLKAVIDRYLAKPLDPDNVVEMIQRTLA
ncbi:MAG TPA: response regulator [Aggregatilineales bacterium]|nr:response regulator [Aggregatilineales bacterium]